jgi:hypothetical protein
MSRAIRGVGVKPSVPDGWVLMAGRKPLVGLAQVMPGVAGPYQVACLPHQVAGNREAGGEVVRWPVKRSKRKKKTVPAKKAQ